MKKMLFIILMLAFAISGTAQTTESKLTVGHDVFTESPNGAFVVPNKDTIGVINPKNGAMIFDTTVSMFAYYQNKWIYLSCLNSQTERFADTQINNLTEAELINLFGEPNYNFMFSVDKTTHPNKRWTGSYHNGKYKWKGI